MSNPSYRHLAQVYDRLFPLDPEALSFVLGTDPRSVVDAGCGTGLLVRALADRGIIAHGFDLDPDLLALANQRAGQGASFAPGDLRTFALPEGLAPDVLVCFGNTAAHLLEDPDLAAFLGRSAAVLGTGGTLLLQVLDYDFLRQSGRLTLPEVRRDDLVFLRRYEVLPSGLWSFETSITLAGGQTLSRSFDLRPWSRRELEAALVEAGFRVEGVWGGFDLVPPGRSLPLVLRASVL